MMRSFLKRLFLLLGISGLLLMGTGCGGNNGGGGGGSTDTAIKQAITSRINSFKTAVEAYDVAGMLGFLAKETGAEKILTIVEEDVASYDKDYTTLESELREDEGKQRHWRKSPAEGGNGYTLTMELGTITFSNIKESGAYAVVPFAIIEAAEKPLIKPQTTDEGRMVCTMVKNQGIWRCEKLTIYYNALMQSSSVGQSAALSVSGHGARRTRSTATQTRGFSFGSFAFE